jgi:uncharacterized HAD superfamily protein
MRKLAIIDIDGVLCDYPNEVFFKFILNKMNIKFKSKEDIVAKLGTSEYEKLKLEYRLSGVKLNIKPRFDAKESLFKLKENGFEIWIVTSRPKWDPVASHTFLWLTNNNFTFDHLMFIEKKGSLKLNINYDRCIIIDDDFEGLKDYTNSEEVTLIHFTNNKKQLSKNVHTLSSWKEFDKLIF